MADNPKVTRVRVYEDKAGEYRWTAYGGLNDAEPLADSGEGYVNKGYARQAAESLFPDVEFDDETAG